MKEIKKQRRVSDTFKNIAMSDEVCSALKTAEADIARQNRRDRRHLIKEPLSDKHMQHLLYPKPSVSEQLEETELVEHLLSEIGKLSDYEQLLIKKRFYDEAPLRAIAEDVGVSVAAIHYKLKSIIKKLSKKIK